MKTFNLLNHWFDTKVQLPPQNQMVKATEIISIQICEECWDDEKFDHVEECWFEDEESPPRLAINKENLWFEEDGETYLNFIPTH